MFKRRTLMKTIHRSTNTSSTRTASQVKQDSHALSVWAKSFLNQLYIPSIQTDPDDSCDMNWALGQSAGFCRRPFKHQRNQVFLGRTFVGYAQNVRYNDDDCVLNVFLMIDVSSRLHCYGIICSLSTRDIMATFRECRISLSFMSPTATYLWHVPHSVHEAASLRCRFRSLNPKEEEGQEKTVPVIISAFDKDVKLNLNQSTIDLLNAAIASHSQSQLQQVQQLLLSTNMQQSNNDIQEETVSSSSPVSTTTATAATQGDANPTTAPKRPGRKPLEKATASDLALDPKQKRKAQNRAAQRAFRERKEKHVSELQERIRELEALTSKTDEDLIQENNRLKEQLKKLEDENYALKDAKFTFEFPVSDQQQQQPDNNNNNNNTNASPISPPDSLASPTTTTPTTTNDMLEDTYGGSSSSSNEQSPRSSNQEDDSDAPATKTPTSLQDPSSFLSFGSITPSQGFDFLAMGSGGSDMFPSSTTTTTTPTPTTSSYDTKDLFHNKGDLFTGYRTSDDFYTDDFLLGNTTGLPALFGGGGDDDLFGFSSTASSANQTTAPFVLDQFYMPDEQPRPHVRKETLQASLQRAKQNGVRAFEVQEQLKNCPDFNLDDLCADLKQKASCCESKYVLTEHDVESYLQCFGQQM
ncbi:hypothetical protein [Absidia glauca]|uniref:BZIP domain-containing protein n=1 Tax=Absidia glauca TaxID=4829 RepID=A0A168QT25_ABSGL|nr:hypothetical protein [Absidia glauca]